MFTKLEKILEQNLTEEELHYMLVLIGDACNAEATTADAILRQHYDGMCALLDAVHAAYDEKREEA